MVKKIITEISEEDFRKLDLKVKKNERVNVSEHAYTFKFVEKSLNDILDNEIQLLLDGGYESDFRDLHIPVTIAIHEGDGYYLDKFMNRFTGAQTFQIGFGIDHLYSTRDYFEMHGDYWKVSKKETKVIYRVKLADHWKDEFVLKHRSETIDWCYNELPDDISPDYVNAMVVINYDLQPDGSWKESHRYGKFIYEHMSRVIPVDENGKKVERKIS